MAVLVVADITFHYNVIICACQSPKAPTLTITVHKLSQAVALAGAQPGRDLFHLTAADLALRTGLCCAHIRRSGNLQSQTPMWKLDLRQLNEAIRRMQ